MSKHFDIIMAGIISGLVAITTTFLGIGGTVIGVVIGSIIYQTLSEYVKDPVVKSNVVNLKNEIVFLFPIVLIIIIEIIYIIAILTGDKTNFIFLENLTNWNLFRAIGGGLIIMGLHPILRSNTIKNRDGYIIVILGILLILRGLIDYESTFVELYKPLFEDFDLFIAIFIVMILSYVSIDIFSSTSKSSIVNKKKDSHLNNNQKYNNKQIVNYGKSDNMSKHDTNNIKNFKLNNSYYKK
jgi:hypothetical protein